MPAVPDDCRISPLAAADIEPLTALAREIWHQHYPGIITVKQIEYMLEQRYSPDTIRAEIESGAGPARQPGRSRPGLRSGVPAGQQEQLRLDSGIPAPRV
jgi:hypothetical protein